MDRHLIDRDGPPPGMPEGFCQGMNSSSAIPEYFSEGWIPGNYCTYEGHSYMVRSFRFHEGPLTYKAGSRLIQKILRQRIVQYREGLKQARENDDIFAIDVFENRLNFNLANLDYYQRKFGTFIA